MMAETHGNMDIEGHTGLEHVRIESPEKAREFLKIAVHDLREPLRAIRSSSELLAGIHAEAQDEGTARCLRFIAEGVDRMELLLRDIAEYCYEELGTLVPMETDLTAALAEAERQLSNELKRNEAILTHDPLPVVMGDPRALTTVFQCLISNSCKFRGSAPPRIHVEAELRTGATQGASEWTVSVRDNGQGFKPAYQERIFEPFERLNGKRYPGSGLGLPLAKTIIEQHAGRIWAESALGQGSKFRFTLPALD
jgi:signal transduction histidine kinase